MAAAVQAAHGLAFTEEAATVPRLDDGAGGGGYILPQALGEVLRKVSDLVQRSSGLLWRQAARTQDQWQCDFKHRVH